MQTTILFGCAVTILVFTASLTWKERLTERLVKVNLEPGEALLYQAEQVLEGVESFKEVFDLVTN